MLQRASDLTRTLAAAAILAVALMAAGCSKPPAEQYKDYMASGQAFVDESDWAAAAIQFRNAARVMPNEADPHYQLALVELQQKKLQDAYGSAARAARIDPDHEQAHLLLAQFEVRYGEESNWDSAQQRLERILAGGRDNTEALFYLAATRARLGEGDEARSLLEEAVQNSPEDLRAVLALAKIKVAENDIPGAEALLKGAIESSEDKRQPLLLLGRFYLDLKRDDDAAEQFNKALEIDPEFGVAMLAIASVHARKSENDQAEALFLKVSKLPEKRYRLLYGQFLAVSGKTDEAITEYARLVEADPTDREARGSLVRAYLATREFEKSERLLTQAVEEAPNDPDARLQRAELYRLLGRLEDSAADVARVLEVEPTSFEGHYLLSKLHEVRGNPRLQRQELDESLRLQPGSMAARVDMARALLQSENPRSALDVLDEAPEAQRNSLPIRNARIGVLVHLGENEKARTQLDIALKIQRTPELVFQDAVLLANEENYEAARASFKEYLEARPRDLRGINQLAGTYVKENKMARALEVVRSYAEQSPESAELQFYLGWWNKQAGYKEEAREAFTAAVAAGDQERSGMELAGLDIADGNVDSARKLVEGVIAVNDRHLPAHKLLANLQEKAGELDEAVASYRRVLELNPDDAVALNNLAYRLAADGRDIDEALQQAQRAKELLPDNPAVSDTIGWIYHLKGVNEMAAVHLKSAVAGNPNDATTRYHLAIALAESGDPVGARESYSEGLALNPDLPEAQLAKDAINKAGN